MALDMGAIFGGSAGEHAIETGLGYSFDDGINVRHTTSGKRQSSPRWETIARPLSVAGPATCRADNPPEARRGKGVGVIAVETANLQPTCTPAELQHCITFVELTQKWRREA